MPGRETKAMEADRKLLEPAEPSGEEPTRILRLGKDEMNLAEFPITLLTDRVPKGQGAIQYQDQIFDEKSGQTITRKLTITAPEEYGLPTAVDDDVILALIQLTKLANNFAHREVEFNRSELIRMLGWPDSGFSYKRLAMSLKRWLSVSLVYDNAWWDRQQRTWTTRGFHILDNFEINNARALDGQGELVPCRVTWNKVVFDSFAAGYLKTIDYQLYLKLHHPTARRMYRFLSKRMYHRPDWTFDIRDFAFEHIGLSRNYSGNAAKIKEKLQPALEELEAIGFLEPLAKEARFQKDGPSWTIRLVQAQRFAPNHLAPPLPTGQEPAAPPGDPPLVAQLVARDVTRSRAVELVKQHPAATIEAKLEIFDWLTETKDKRLARSPAGWLVKAIEDDYAAPKGFENRPDRERRRQADADRRRQSEADARARAEDEAVDRYWAALTPPQQAELDKAARALADLEALAQETGPLKRLGTAIRRRAYIRRLLHERGATASDRE
jgi:hypothetical protein